MHSWIESNAALAAWLGARATASIGLDTEFMRTRTFAARLALMQICVGGDVALVDVVAEPRPSPLLAQLVDPAVTCIMHSPGEDLEAMAPLLPDGPAELFDTQVAAALAGFGFGMSYQKLVARLFGTELAKAETRSDWLQRPLSAAQLDYAAQDVVWLPRLHGELAQRLEALGRSGWLREDCRSLVDRVCHAEPDPQPQRGFRAAADWPIERQALLRKLLLWREASARRLDKPRPWLLDDAHALRLAASPPAGAEELFERTRGLRALRGPQRQELLALLRAPLTDDDLAIVPVPAPLDPPRKRALAAMKESVAAIARELDIPEALLCARRHIDSLLTDGAWPAALEGWRKELLHDKLIELVP